MPTFGFESTNISTPNPSAVNTTGNASQSIFGNLNSSTPSLFANTGNSPGPIFGTATNSTPTTFVVNTTGSPSNSLFCYPPSSAPKPPFTVNTNGNTSTSIFGNTSNSTPNPFVVNTNGNTTSPSLSSHGLSRNGTSTGGFGTSPTASGLAAGPTGISGSHMGLALHSALGVGPIGNTTCGPVFGQPSNNIMTSGSDMGLASQNSALRAGPFGNTPFGAFGQPSNNISGIKGPASPFTFPGISTSSDEPSASAGTATFEAQAHPSQIKGSKNFPYRTTKCDQNGYEFRLQSISAMRIYGSKSHEELRFEDSELNSRGSSSRFPPHFPDTNAAQNPFLRSQTPSTNSTTIFNQPSFPNLSSNLDTSSTTTPAVNNQLPSFPFPAGQSLSNPTPIFNQPSSPFLSSSPSPFNFSTSSTTTSSSFPINTSFPNPTPSTFNFYTTQYSFGPSFDPNPLSIPLVTSAATGNAQANSATSASALTGNNGGSTGKIGDCIIAVKEPVGSESATRRIEWLLYFSLVLIFVFVLIKVGF